MMADTLVEKNTCKECGADVRPETAFCYNCGKPVTQMMDAQAEDASDVWFAETLAFDTPIAEPEGSDEIETVVGKPEVKTEVAAVDPNAETRVFDEPVEEAPEVPELDPLHHSLPTESALRSAASIRKKPKSFNRREVEVVWEEHQNPPVAKLILVTLGLVLFTVIVFLLAMQMK